MFTQAMSSTKPTAPDMMSSDLRIAGSVFASTRDVACTFQGDIMLGCG